MHKRDSIRLGFNNTKTVMKTKKVSLAISSRLTAVILGLSAFILMGSALLPGLTAYVRADQYDEQINALQQQNSASRGALSDLLAQAASYQDAINKLQQQINALQAAIDANVAQQQDLQAKIVESQQEIDHQKTVLAANVKSGYVDGTPSTLEMLATSKNLSDFVDKQEFRTRVQNNIQDTLKKIAALQKQLQDQKAQVEKLLADQNNQQSQLASTQAEQNSLLAYNEGQQATYNQQIASNNSQIQSLRQAQIAANARFIGGAGNGPACGGGYPARWCEIPQDSVIDNWGMYNRECVSYTAFRVAASGRYMPYWGGIGNANQWDDNARAWGIPVDQNPRPGDVAISNAGYYGHAMYVESVNGDGTINISQYNASLNGTYSTRSNLNPAGLWFIHF